LHSGSLQLGEIVDSFLVSDRKDGLYTTVVVDEQGIALGLVYSDKDSLIAALKRRKGIYHSRKRGLWEKGLTSGATQDLIGVDLDCDRDAVRFIVRQHGAGFCHFNRRTCWDEDRGIGALFRTLESRRANPVAKSYTNRLFNDPDLLASKLLEEANELLEAKTHDEIAWEAADLVYFASVLCARSQVSWNDVENMLDRRSRRIRRRKGDAKPPATASTNK
jgi:phosphoribosyl-ATP pyrophosphohydrolase / phosphoribosyl-AMP cyclohydrolase / histidinol dehydrogenase